MGHLLFAIDPLAHSRLLNHHVRDDVLLGEGDHLLGVAECLQDIALAAFGRADEVGSCDLSAVVLVEYDRRWVVADVRRTGAQCLNGSGYAVSDRLEAVFIPQFRHQLGLRDSALLSLEFFSDFYPLPRIELSGRLIEDLEDGVSITDLNRIRHRTYREPEQLLGEAGNHLVPGDEPAYVSAPGSGLFVHRQLPRDVREARPSLDLPRGLLCRLEVSDQDVAQSDSAGEPLPVYVLFYFTVFYRCVDRSSLVLTDELRLPDPDHLGQVGGTPLEALASGFHQQQFYVDHGLQMVSQLLLPGLFALGVLGQFGEEIPHVLYSDRLVSNRRDRGIFILRSAACAN